MRPVKPWDMLDPRQPRSGAEAAESRLTICRECPEFHPTVKICGECGCFMPAKVHLAQASCPVGRWLPMEEEQS